ncbi:hypothetical protein OKA05_25295 [Luteolibacter arcticus]|uniref:DUF1236 domain-containing protein n=1 Tax=Luteolibacter arcticus TaxID=1581411 RepID=A0ABT3GQU8_9BACT|nr:hypothetical protein [Luteolibacter arcticus]MCW1925900.1 hypothetical protein [Luteolibacter arcticus]
MKTTTTSAIALAALGMIVPLSAQVTEKKEKTEVRENADGSTTEKHTTTTTTFNPEARTKVVKYFDTYKTERYGLPPAYVTKVRVKEIPAAWRTSVIAPGIVITEKERPYLIDAPPELIKVLPAPASSDVRYYMAGGNVVAVDKTYKVVDSIQVPSVKITVDD